MKIIYMDENSFDDFSKKHVLHTYYQTSSYAKLMASQGYKYQFLGFMENDTLVGASLILYDKLMYKFKYAYAPRGLLIDYTDNVMVNKVTASLKKYLMKEDVIFLKLDPPVIDYKRDQKGNIVAQAQVLSNRVLQSCGYQFLGNNLYFETLKPRWNAVVNFNNTDMDVMKHFNKSARNKIHKSQKRQINITQLQPNELNRFYKYVARKHYRNLRYYSFMQQFFGENFETYVISIDTEKYLKVVQALFENEQSKNSLIGQEMQSNSTKGIDMRNLISRKMESDKILNNYDVELKNAIELLAKYPSGLDIGAGAIIKTDKKIYFLIDGFDQKYRNISPSYYFKWYIMQKYNKLGYKIFDLNAITGNFTNNNKYKGLNNIKLSFNSEINEYIGEFDLIINAPLYNTYKKLGAIGIIKRKIK